MISIVLPRLYEKQRGALFSGARIAVCEASTKSGKTAGALVWLLHEALTRPGSSCLWLSPVYPQAKMQGFARMKRMLIRADPQRATGWADNISELWIDTPGGGGRVWFKGGDNPDSIYGADYSAVVIDEASRVKEDAWHAVRSTTTATRGPIRIIGNVKGRKNWAYRMARRAESGDDGMHFARITAYDAAQVGVIDADEIEAAKRDLPDAIFRELYLAEAASDDGNPFGAEAINECMSTLSLAPPVCFGIDLGSKVDWAVIVGLDAACRVAKFDRFKLDWSACKLRIQSAVGSLPALVDATGVGDAIVTDLQRTMPLVTGRVFTSASKQSMMGGLALALHQRSIRIIEECRSELESFEYEYTRTGIRYSAPQGMHDDIVCALALALEQYQTRRGSDRIAAVIGGEDVETGEPGWNDMD